MSVDAPVSGIGVDVDVALSMLFFHCGRFVPVFGAWRTHVM